MRPLPAPIVPYMSEVTYRDDLVPEYGLTSPVKRAAGDILFVEAGIAVLPLVQDDRHVPSPHPHYVDDGEFATAVRVISRAMFDMHVKRLEEVVAGKVFLSATRNSDIDDAEIITRILFRPCQTPCDKQITRVVDTMPGNVDDRFTNEVCKDVVTRFFADSRELADEFAEDEEPVGVFGFLSGLLNHCCQPNAELCIEEDGMIEESPVPERETPFGVQHYTIRLQAIKPIQAGEELTVCYDPHITGSSRADQLSYYKVIFGFACRCGICGLEEKDKIRRLLRNDVLNLFGEIQNFRRPEGLQVYKKAAYILDGFAELELTHDPVKQIWDICADRASSCCDMIRAHFFTAQALQHMRSILGKTNAQERPWTEYYLARLREFREGLLLNEPDIVGYSTIPAGSYDMQQEGLSELMFGLNHENSDTYYYCLRLVNGKVEEIPLRENIKRLATIQAERDANAASKRKIEEGAGSGKPMHELTLEEQLALIEDQSAVGTTKKKSKKKKRNAANAESTATEESPDEDSSATTVSSESENPTKVPESASELEKPVLPAKMGTEVQSGTARSESGDSDGWITTRRKKKVSQQAQNASTSRPNPFGGASNIQQTTEKSSVRSSGRAEPVASSPRENLGSYIRGPTSSSLLHKPTSKPEAKARVEDYKKPLAMDGAEAARSDERPLPVIRNGRAKESSKGSEAVQRPVPARAVSPVHVKPALPDTRPVQQPAEKTKDSTTKKQSKLMPWSKISLRYGFVFNVDNPDGISKFAWLRMAGNKEKIRIDKARDIGHLLAAKDGYKGQREEYVLSTRRDSVCGRVQGQRELVELGPLAERRRRTHSY